MAILDNRTLYDAAESTTGWVDAGGAGTGFSIDAELRVEGTNALSSSFTLTSGELGILYNNGSEADRSNTIWYLWYNFLAPGALQPLASAGVTVRFCGATITNWIEFNVLGSDNYGGGWTMLVIDIEATPSNTNGTPPATSAIQYVGTVTAGLTSMPKMADNIAQDAIWYIDATEPVIRVEGTNSGPDWTWDDIVDAAEPNGWGIAERAAGGGVRLRGGVRFGANDGVTHGFSDTNQIILFEEPIFSFPAGFLQLDVIGGSGTQSFSAGLKTGSGDDATGAQGWIVSADAGGARWDINSNDANIDVANWYGCTFLHGGATVADEPLTSVISNLFIDCSSALVSGVGDFLRNSIINAATADGVGFITTDDVTDIVFCNFEFSDGHAIELTTPAVLTQTSKGNLFTSYGASGSTDAAIYNNTSTGITINVTTQGDTPTIRNGAGASTIVNNNIQVTITGLRDLTEVRIYDNATSNPQIELAGIEDATDGSPDDRTFAFSLGASEVVDIVFHNKSYDSIPPRSNGFVIPVADTSFSIVQLLDANYNGDGS